MIVSLSFKYRFYAIKIPLFIASAFFLIPIYAWATGTSDPETTILNIAIWSILFLTAFSLAITFSVKGTKSKRIAKKGKSGFLGEDIHLDKHCIEFYYKLEDGRLGKTSQRIKGKVYNKLNSRECRSIPIVIYENQAVIDYKKILSNEPFPIEELHISETIEKPIDNFTYGRLNRGFIWFALTFLFILFIVLLFTVFTNSFASTSGRMAMFVFLFINPFAPFFLSLAFVSIRNHYYVPKILENGVTEDKKKKAIMGTLIPLVNTKKENEKFSKGNEIAFRFKGKDGQLHQTNQYVSRKVRKAIDAKHEKEVQICLWRNHAVINEKAIVGETWIKKVLGFISDHHLVFFAMLAVNTFFFASELISAIGSKFTSTLSVFGAVLYLMTIIYTTIMEILEWKKKNPYYGYAITILFLVSNLVILPGLYIFGSVNDDMTFVTLAASFFNTYTMTILTIFIYLLYLFVKFLVKIIQAHQAKVLGEHFDRCQTFGDIISNFYTLLVFIAHILIIVFFMNADSSVVMVSFVQSAFIQVIFIIILVLMTILDLILLIKCAKVMKRSFKNKLPIDEDIEESLILTHRLVLRNLKFEDKKTIIGIMKDPAVNKTYMVPQLNNKKDEETLFNRLKNLCDSKDRIGYGIYLETKPIGFIHSVYIEKKSIEVGYFIDPKQWNKGYATEALSALISDLFDDGYTSVEAAHFEGNDASARVMQKSGMKKTSKTEVVEYMDIKHTCIYYEIKK